MKLFRPLIVSFGSLVLVTGVAYPAVVTGLARITFPWKAQGSLVQVDGQVRGSRLIAQATEDPRYFWCRPSGTATQAPSNPALREAVARRVQFLRESDPGNAAPIPQDLVTDSASGLDPHISPEAAAWQVSRVARLRGMDLKVVQALVDRHTERSLMSPARVNVLELNLALDGR